VSWLPCVSSWATRIFGIAMRMTIQEVGTLVAVGARNSSRALPAKTSRSGQASRSATANVPSHDGIGLPPTVSQDCQLSSVFRVRLSREAGPHRVSGEESIGTGCAGRRFTLLATARSLSPRRPLSADPGTGHKTTPICGPRTTLAPDCRAGLRSPRSRRDGRVLPGVRRGITVRRRMRGVPGNWSRARHRGRAPCL
jgi:hypothetical protein